MRIGNTILHLVMCSLVFVGCHRSAATDDRTTDVSATAESPTVAMPAGDMARTASRFLGTLSDSARALARLPFDSATRMTWNYVPLVRPGAPRRLFTLDARNAGDALLRTGLSSDGAATAYRIMRQEAILGDIEVAAGRADARSRRDSTLYYWGIFGTPSADSAWGWRVEGHHLSVNVTAAGAEGAVAAPLFMGVSPARVMDGPQKGLRVLAREEDEARALWAQLDEAQRRRARIADTTTRDLVTRNAPRVSAFDAVGLPASAMTNAQRAGLQKLLQVYAGRMAAPLAQRQLTRIEAAGFDKLHFAWAGSTEPGKAHYYRIHGPTVLVEYENSQNDANHIHSVWRDLEHDFGGDLLRAHYAKHPHRR